VEFWLTFLPIVIYVLLIALLIIGIVLGVKAIITMNKVEKVVDNISEKVESLNSIFSFIDWTTDRISAFTDRLVDTVSGIFGKIFLRGRRKKDKEIED